MQFRAQFCVTLRTDVAELGMRHYLFFTGQVRTSHHMIDWRT
jgi:hypothetical protein